MHMDATDATQAVARWAGYLGLRAGHGAQCAVGQVSLSLGPPLLASTHWPLLGLGPARQQ